MSNLSRFSKIKKFASGHPLLISVFFSVFLGFGAAFVLQILSLMSSLSVNMSSPVYVLTSFWLIVLIVGIILGGFVIFPIVLTIIEIYLLVTVPQNANSHNRGRAFDLSAMILGVLYSGIYLSLMQSVLFSCDWDVTLANAQTHTPVYTQAAPTVWAFAAIGFAGYLTVNFIPLKKTPPLVLVLGISAMYLGTLESVVWGYQVYDGEFESLCLLLLPLNCLLITARTVVYKVREWKEIPREMHKIDRVPFLRWCNRILEKSEIWPVAAFFLMWPLVGILIGILVLFGQAPDSIIRAWTETSGWNLSQRVSPQNIYYDEHYLCTVAAGGHKKIVKPMRLGVRHGHEVIVNRQLCVANAFEQILEEKTPRFHRVIRNFYDKYGFPIAKWIRSKYAADLIYFVMKPLEWLFLAVIYLTDANPENRIAVQYTGKHLRELLPD